MAAEDKRMFSPQNMDSCVAFVLFLDFFWLKIDV